MNNKLFLIAGIASLIGIVIVAFAKGSIKFTVKTELFTAELSKQQSERKLTINE